MKSRNHLYATIHSLKLSRNNWRNKYKMLKDKHDATMAHNGHVIKYLVIEIVKLECELNQLKREESKINGWQVFRERYEI